MSCMGQWVPLLDNCLATAAKPHTFTFCTVSTEGMPRARTCVFRSWLFNDKSTGVLMFTTDRRSLKVSDLERNEGKFEACFWFPKEGCQFRLSGFSQLLGEEKRPSMFSQNIPAVHPLASPSSSPSSTNSSSSSFYPVFTPSFNSNTEYETEFPPPSEQEWANEYHRMWQAMPSHIKSGFRKPTPRTLLTDQARRQLDSIDRGVDGASDEQGKENFLVVCMFVNSVDFFKDDPSSGGKRQLFTRTRNDDWIEQDVCP